MNLAEMNATALAGAKTRKIKNALTAILCGSVPAAVLGTLFRTSPLHWLVGFGVGLVWANAFEYFYHRYLLHLPSNYLGRLHQLHHASVGTPLEMEHLNLGGTPPLVLAAFVLNGLVITLLAEVLLKLRISPGIFIAFTVYVIAIEEVHWRIHVGGWLPSWLQFGREHHLVHHDRPNGRYNVFLPLFDWLLGTAKD
jgi:Fatty acid hydroxylase superfamily